MGKLRILSVREVCRILEQHGFQVVRQRGNHILMQGRTDVETDTALVPDHAEIGMGILQSIIRQNGISRSAFES